jgi:hypothetical protein
MVHIEAQREDVAAPAPEDEVNVGFGLRTDGIALAITNRGADPIDVLWQNSKLVDIAERESGVLHSEISSGGLPDARAGGDISTIPPSSTLSVMLIPADRIVFDSYYGWLVEPLLPVECGPVRCTGYHELVGHTVRPAEQPFQ